MAPPLRYVALGDSYTVGTSVPAAERWPDQLVRRVPGLSLVANVAVNGYATDDVMRDELPRLAALRPEFASLLIGVNDVVRGMPPVAYRSNLVKILDALLVALPAWRIVTVSTPDYTVTPMGGSFGRPESQRAGIEANNAVLRELAEARDIAFADIYEISGRAANDPSLVAGDGLHPSGVQYRLWVDVIEPVVLDLLQRD
jgi:lysophospholipase L1-like esterase